MKMHDATPVMRYLTPIPPKIPINTEKPRAEQHQGYRVASQFEDAQAAVDTYAVE